MYFVVNDSGYSSWSNTIKLITKDLSAAKTYIENYDDYDEYSLYQLVDDDLVLIREVL